MKITIFLKRNMLDIMYFSLLLICVFTQFFFIPKMDEERMKITGVIMIVTIITSAVIYGKIKKYLEQRKQKTLDEFLTK